MIKKFTKDFFIKKKKQILSKIKEEVENSCEKSFQKCSNIFVCTKNVDTFSQKKKQIKKCEIVKIKPDKKGEQVKKVENGFLKDVEKVKIDKKYEQRFSTKI